MLICNLSSQVRAYAVSVLERADDEELLCYLLQLVQALRFERSDKSRLSHFLVQRGMYCDCKCIFCVCVWIHVQVLHIAVKLLVASESPHELWQRCAILSSLAFFAGMLLSNFMIQRTPNVSIVPTRFWKRIWWRFEIINFHYLSVMSILIRINIISVIIVP